MGLALPPGLSLLWLWLWPPARPAASVDRPGLALEKPRIKEGLGAGVGPRAAGMLLRSNPWRGAGAAAGGGPPGPDPAAWEPAALAVLPVLDSGMAGTAAAGRRRERSRAARRPPPLPRPLLAEDAALPLSPPEAATTAWALLRSVSALLRSATALLRSVTALLRSVTALLRSVMTLLRSVMTLLRSS